MSVESPSREQDSEAGELEVAAVLGVPAGITRSAQRARVTSGAPDTELASVRACRPPQRMRRARRRYEP
ncbi:hypothetical protein OV208_16855 [Corallococcus sp. bb12-1]|uniref:hypothetical protein n=1 Tax=Corallococcus sp. bb12-1 TaxID=2996784 RepID=UPI002271471E|nr:hypothetical protein [Corallococcus sp. bb12-1]MCY1042992.1 hypothetical protein [Corallococcus sp. bb12-1]